MPFTRKLQTISAAAVLAASTIVAAPAEAGSFGLRGSGLIGGLALGLLAASAARGQGTSSQYEVYELPQEEVLEREVRIRRVEPRQPRQVRASRPPQVAPQRQTAGTGNWAAVVRSCGESLADATRPYGNTRVVLATTGEPKRGRDGSLSAPVDARLEYTRQGGREVRQARVTCRADARGRIVSYR